MQEIFPENSRDEKDATIIFSGGNIDTGFAEMLLKQHKNSVLIAADRGIDTMLKMDIVPDFIIGDFDSASEEDVQNVYRLKEAYNIPVTKLVPEKDDTDTEAALTLALKHTNGDIYILGGTGTRIDHMLGNIAILGKAKDKGRHIILIDSHNRVEMLFHNTAIKKSELFGPYISFFSFGDKVEKLTLEGFKYPLKDYDFGGYNSLGVSNELLQDEGYISFESGALIMVQARD